MNSNRFISRLMDQTLSALLMISTLKFMPSTGEFDLILYSFTWFIGILNGEGPGFCQKFDMDVYFLWIFYRSFVCSFYKILIKYFFIKNYYYHRHYDYYHYHSILFLLTLKFVFHSDTLQTPDTGQKAWRVRGSWTFVLNSHKTKTKK